MQDVHISVLCNECKRKFNCVFKYMLLSVLWEQNFDI